MAPARFKTNHNLVVTVRVPKASPTRRHHQQQQQKKKKQEEVKRGLQLCDLPADLVTKIVEGLSSADRIRFGATCKNNLSLFTITKNHRGGYQYQFREIDKLPWLATFYPIGDDMRNLSLVFGMYEPLHIQGQPNYLTYQITDHKGDGFGRLNKITLKASNKGWLLCLWPKEEEETGLTSFLLFSPFNKRIIKLPDLDHNIDLTTCQATFSSDPSSPDCVYFFLSQNSIPGEFRISTLDQTSQEWKTTVFDKNIHYVSSVVYGGGCFYCLSSIGQLAAYDVFHQSWKAIISSSPISSLLFSSDAYIVVCEGKVILVVLCAKPLEYKVEMKSCTVFQFCSSNRTWVKKRSLGNNALFVGYQTSFSVRVIPSSSSDNIADRVYFYSSSNKPFYYSLKDGRCHQCKDSSYWSSTDVNGGLWIEPP